MPRDCWSELGYGWEISGVRACFDSPRACAPRGAPDGLLPWSGALFSVSRRSPASSASTTPGGSSFAGGTRVRPRLSCRDARDCLVGGGVGPLLVRILVGGGISFAGRGLGLQGFGRAWHRGSPCGVEKPRRLSCKLRTSGGGADQRLRANGVRDGPAPRARGVAAGRRTRRRGPLDQPRSSGGEPSTEAVDVRLGMCSPCKRS